MNGQVIVVTQVISAFFEVVGIAAILTAFALAVRGGVSRTVAVQPTLPGLAVLAALVGIRTFLSWSLEVEIDGRWPWQRRRETA